jgi:hypothetical protein
MSTVYSTQLATGKSVTGGPFVAYTTPSGIRAVITCISLMVGINASPGALLVSAGPDLPVICTYAQEATLAPAGLVQEGRWVLNDGDQITFETGGVWVGDFFVSGFELLLP